MKITILGSGSAYGVPMIFNQWGDVNPLDPHNQRTRASIYIEEKGKSILIDASPELRIQANKNNITNIDAVFITHAHYDHIGGIPELPRAAKLLNHGIDVYATTETMAGLKDNYSYLFQEKPDAEPDSKKINWKILPDSGKFIAADLEFDTLQFLHHHIHSSGFRYKNFAYVTDWQAFPEDCENFFNNLDLLIVECNNGTKPEDNGHSDLNKIIEIKERFNPKRMILSHLSWRIDAKNFTTVLPDGCELSYDGMIIEI